MKWMAVNFELIMQDTNDQRHMVVVDEADVIEVDATGEDAIEVDAMEGMEEDDQGAEIEEEVDHEADQQGEP